MKRLTIILTFVGLMGCFENKAQETPLESTQLSPLPNQSRIQELVMQFLSYYHFSNKTFKLDDTLSSKLYDNYLDMIDGGKYYFTNEDIKKFERHRFIFDDALNKGDLKVAFEIYNSFLERQRNRNEFVEETLKSKFDFTIDETFETDRDKAPRPKNEAEMNDNWRKLLKSQALDLKLTGKSDSAIAATLKERYKAINKRLSKKRPEDVFQEYMNAFTETFDPHTNYFNPTNAESFKIEMSQSLEGIGATLTNEGDYVKIADLIVGGPAARSGLVLKGDRIVGVAQGENGQIVDIIGWLTNDAVKLIRGAKGTTVKLQLLPADAVPGSPVKEVKIVREKIKIEDQVCKREIIDVKHNKKDFKIGVIEIPMFYRDFDYAKRGNDFQSTTRDVKRFLEEFKTKNVDGVVIDLRNDGGGSLTEAINLTGLFISKGPVVQRKDNRGEVSVEGDNDADVAYTGPLAVIINRFSASASEIFAGAIQDYRRGVIVGEQSFGKGTVQQLIDLDQFAPSSGRVASRNGAAGNGGAEDGKERYGQLKLTTEKFYRVTGSSTQRKGVYPDIELPTPYESEEFGESSQKTALVWDVVKTSNFEQTKVITDKNISKLKEKYQDRLTSDTELKKLEADILEYKKAKNVTLVSLQEIKRKKERDEFEARRKAIAALSGGGDKKEDKDILLKESERILCDLIQIQK
jgi:carboxyl-terminal processing protease